jgi:hypothetical protein
MNALLVIAAAVVALAAVRALRRALPAASPQGPPASIAPSAGVAGDLEWMDRIVAGASHAGELHWRLRPVLREIAASGLHRHGVELDEQPEAARALLAQGTWELVRPERPRPEDPFAPGVRREELRMVLEDLGRLFG